MLYTMDPLCTAMEISDEHVKESNESVYSIIVPYSKVYGLSKLVYEMLSAYGADVDHGHNSIQSHIERVEEAMYHSANHRLIKTIRRLFYVVYARLLVEIWNVKLSQSYQFDIRSMALSPDRFTETYLPEPAHLSVILQACKEELEAEDIRTVLGRDMHVVFQHQEEYLRHAIMMAGKEGTGSKGMAGYRQHVQSLIFEGCPLVDNHNPSSSEDGIDKKPRPGSAIAKLLERYLELHLKGKRLQEEYDAERIQRATRRRSLPEGNYEDEKHILAHREAASAMLNGQSAGEYRRLEGRWALAQYIRENLCVCLSHCSCAKRCTLEGSESCPCSPRVSALCSKYRPVDKPTFIQKCSRVALAMFETLCMVRRDTPVFELQVELRTGLNIFHEEILRYRELPCQLNI